MSNVTVTLRKAINVEGVDVQELTLREPTVKDLLAQDRIVGDNAQMVALISALADIPDSSVKQIAARDFVKLAKVVGDFLDDGQATGGN